MIWTKSDIQNARKCKLFELFKKMKYNLKKIDQDNYYLEHMPNIIIKRNYWYDKTQKKGGNPIDFFTKIEQLSFMEAMKKIMSN